MVTCDRCGADIGKGLRYFVAVEDEPFYVDTVCRMCAVDVFGEAQITQGERNVIPLPRS